MPIKVEDMIGKTYNQLTVLEYDCQTPSGQKKFRCQCSCGKFTSVASYDIRKGKTKSCGCLKLTSTRTHGMSKSSEYSIWCGIKSRCNIPSQTVYRYYGGRGIKICDEWNNSFQAFYNYLGPRPGPEYSVDRIDSDGHYEPGNVRWATPDEQWSNRKSQGMTINSLQHEARKRDFDRRDSDDLNIAALTLGSEVGKFMKAAQNNDTVAAEKALSDLLVEIAEVADILNVSLQTLAIRGIN